MAKTTKKLKNNHRAFLVREFACFATPSEAAEALKQDFGIEISPQGAQHYEVKSVGGKRAAPEWHELFQVARAAFLEHVSNEVPEAHKAFRIQQLARASRIFKQNKNYLAMANMLERIAKEMGNVHTNRHEFMGKGGGAIQYQDVETMTDEQINQELKQIFAQSGLALVPIN